MWVWGVGGRRGVSVGFGLLREKRAYGEEKGLGLEKISHYMGGRCGGSPL
jgi:hypothetical protein